jgi:uncharacterized membrane protein YhiD involved in acid resistance
MLQQIDKAGAAASAPLSIESLLLNILVGALLSWAVRWHFQRYGSTLSNREEFAQVFPFVCLTTVLVISVVKSSLALSLGLVGALSIVRFRTPIKEPEELAYLFIAIAIGLGLGANQTFATIAATVAILTVMAFFKLARTNKEGKNLFLSIDWRADTGEKPERFLERLNDVLGKHAADCDLRRFDLRDDSLDATYFVDVENAASLSALTDELQNTFPSVGVTFIDQNRLPSV